MAPPARCSAGPATAVAGRRGHHHPDAMRRPGTGPAEATFPFDRIEITENVMQRQDHLDEAERKRIQEKQGGHHYPPRPEDGPPMDDTDRNTDKVIKPSRRKP